MIFAKGDRVQALASLFDEGTEDEHGRKFSQRERDNGNGLYCFGRVTHAHKVRGRTVNPPPLLVLCHLMFPPLSHIAPIAYPHPLDPNLQRPLGRWHQFQGRTCGPEARKCH